MLEDLSDSVPLVMMITIFNRSEDDRVLKIFAEGGVNINLLALGRGTANSKLSNYLGLGETEKSILFSTMSLPVSKGLLKTLGDEIDLGKPGRGLAFTIPMDSICGATTAKCLQGSPPAEKGEINMEQTFQHDLIVAIINRGYSDVVMEAAKQAMATGGTVINARGTALNDEKKFFGVTIQPEKELILILARSEHKRGIMEAIAASGAGSEEGSRPLVFSLPVNGLT